MKHRIYHNPRCSKSRAALELLRSRGIEPQIIEYLREPPTYATLKTLVRKLGIAPRELVRTAESDFKQLDIDLGSTPDDEIINLLADHPKLLQRPIVETASGARIGRPPERVLELLE